MIGFHFSFSLSREEFSEKLKIDQYWNAYLVSSIVDDMVWGFNDENCRLVKRWSEKGI